MIMFYYICMTRYTKREMSQLMEEFDSIDTVILDEVKWFYKNKLD